MPFSFLETALPGVRLVVPQKYSDARGFFMELLKRGGL
jgi:dTDP-4-dehydrorhamnose 3,5-epimerase-like enzyme